MRLVSEKTHGQTGIHMIKKVCQNALPGLTLTIAKFLLHTEENNLNLISTCQFYKRNVLRDLCTVKGLQVILVLLLGGFQLEFVNISRVINHMTCYKFECSHCIGGKCLPLSVAQLKGKHCQKPHCCNGVVDTFGFWQPSDTC